MKNVPEHLHTKMQQLVLAKLPSYHFNTLCLSPAACTRAYKAEWTEFTWASILQWTTWVAESLLRDERTYQSKNGKMNMWLGCQHVYQRIFSEINSMCTWASTVGWAACTLESTEEW